MSNEKGKPTASSNDQHGTGIPQNIKPVAPGEVDKYTEDFVNEEGEISEQIRTNNPNRNIDKEDATNAGGYRN